MRQQIHHSTRRIVSLAVLGMLAIAVVAGQASANLPIETTAAHVSSAQARMLIIDLSQLRQAEIQPKLLDLLLTKPSRVEINLERLAESPETRTAPAGTHSH